MGETLEKKVNEPTGLMQKARGFASSWYGKALLGLLNLGVVTGAVALDYSLKDGVPQVQVGSAEAGEKKQDGWPLPNTDKSDWLITENHYVDKIPDIPGKETYVEVWKTTGRKQGEKFCKTYGITDVDAPFKFFIYRLAQTGAVYMAGIARPGKSSVDITDLDGNGTLEDFTDKKETSTTPHWLKVENAKPKSYFPLPELATANFIQTIGPRNKLDYILGKDAETTIYVFEAGDERVALYSLPNGKIYGFGKKNMKTGVMEWRTDTDGDRNFDGLGKKFDINSKKYGY